MTKTKFITVALIVCAAFSNAQTEKKPVTVRIKKVEKINGVEKVTDTTYTTTDPSSIEAGNADIRVIELNKEGENSETHVVNTDGNPEAEQSSLQGKKKVVIVKSSAGDGANSSVITSEEMSPEIEAEIKKALKEAGVDENVKGRKTVVVHNESKTDEGKGEKKTVKVVVVHAGLCEASSEECKKAGISQPKNKLEIEEMNCTPNPSNGKFNLKFSSPEKGAADIKVRDMGGKVVYSENVKDFGGSYSKEISLDAPSKGIYLVTIMQNEKSVTKKIVVE
jgi:hypothetical protein